MDNDAKSCYARIIYNLAMKISQYYGTSKSAATTQGKMLLKMQYRLRTALGDSKHFYQPSQNTPIHGTGQGSCTKKMLLLRIGL
jgi:hypothetical protein